MKFHGIALAALPIALAAGSTGPQPTHPYLPDIPDEITVTYQPGDGNGPYSDGCDWSLFESFPELTGTPWSDDVVVGKLTWAPWAGEVRWLIHFPNFIGTDPSQVPVFAEVIDASLEILAGPAAGVPVEVRRITEENLGQAGSVEGQDSSKAPSWVDRFHDEPWAAAGAGWPASSSLLPEDVRTVASAFEWTRFSITGAVQAWVDDPASNQGLLVSSADLSLEGQHFMGIAGTTSQSGMTPILTVTYRTVPDQTPPSLSVSSPDLSPVRRAFVEGLVGPDAVSVQFQVDAGPWEDAVRQSATRWHAWVPALEEEQATVFRARASDAAGNAAEVEQLLTWEPTELSASTQVVMAMAETLLVGVDSTPPETELIELDPGDGQPPVQFTPGGHVQLTYPQAGSYLATGTLLGPSGEVLGAEDTQVVVIEVMEKRSVACQVGFLRTVDFSLVPLSAFEAIHVAAGDPTLAVAKNARLTGDALLVDLSPYKPVDTRIQVRLEGPQGRLLHETAVASLVMMHIGQEYVDPCACEEDEQEISFSMQVSPPEVLDIAPSLRFDVEVFSDGTSFPPQVDPDGDKVVQLSVDDFDEQGIATLVALFTPALAPEFCRSITGFDQALDGTGTLFQATEKRGGNKKACNVDVEGPTILCSCGEIKLSATNESPTGGTYKWKVSGGAAKIVGEDDKKSVVIGGVSASGSLGDTEVTVTYTPPGVDPCTSDPHELTVVAVSIADLSRGEHTDGIPPQVATDVQVTIAPSLEGSSHNIHFSITGKDGKAEITKNSVRQTSGPITVLGTKQSSPSTYSSRPLKIQGKLDGGQLCAESNPFTVCAHPIDFNLGKGYVWHRECYTFKLYWGSDSGKVSHLNQVTIQEHVDYDGKAPNPPFTHRYWQKVNDPSVALQYSGTLGTVGKIDKHVYYTVTAGIEDSWTGTQFYRYRCKRCDPPGDPHDLDWGHLLHPNPYEIIRYVEKLKTGKWQYRVTKDGDEATKRIPSP